MNGADAALLGGAGLLAGVINGVAGGGSMVSFPALLAVGHPAIVANVTSTVGIWTGYLGGAAGFRDELRAQPGRVRTLLPIAVAGGIAGSVLLLVTPSEVFEGAAPFLVLGATLLFALQPLVRRRVVTSGAHVDSNAEVPASARWGTFAAAIYGAYFGAGLGVILLAVLGLTVHDALVRINGLRGALSLVINSLAVLIFGIAADVAWGAAGVLAVGSLVGGYTGARLSRRLPNWLLRTVVIGFGLVAGVALLL